MRLFELKRKCLSEKLSYPKIFPNIPMSTLEIRKHQLYLKQTVVSAKSWAWQPHQEL